MLYCLRGVLSISFSPCSFHSCQFTFLRLLLRDATSGCYLKITIYIFPEKSHAAVGSYHQITVSGTLSELSRGSCGSEQLHAERQLGAAVIRTGSFCLRIFVFLVPGAAL